MPYDQAEFTDDDHNDRWFNQLSKRELKGVFDEYMGYKKEIDEMAKLLRCKPAEINEKTEKLLFSIEETKEELERLKRKLNLL